MSPVWAAYAFLLQTSFSSSGHTGGWVLPSVQLAAVTRTRAVSILGSVVFLFFSFFLFSYIVERSSCRNLRLTRGQAVRYLGYVQ